MKIRNGFVSNSSSSSFLCIVPNDEFKKFIDSKSDGLEKDILIEISTKSNKIKLFNVDCTVITWISGNAGDSYEQYIPADIENKSYYEEDYSYIDDVYNILSKFTEFVENLSKNGRGVYHSEYF